MTKKKIKEGQVFGKWKIIEESLFSDKGYLCHCTECGGVALHISEKNIHSERIPSCTGCQEVKK